MVALARSRRVFYLAGWPDKSLLQDVVRRLFLRAGVATLDLPEHIRVRDNGATRYVFNYGAEPTDISDAIGDAALLLGERILEPCGVAAAHMTRREICRRSTSLDQRIASCLSGGGEPARSITFIRDPFRI